MSQGHCRMHQGLCCMAQPATKGKAAPAEGATKKLLTTGLGLGLGLVFTITTVVSWGRRREARGLPDRLAGGNT